MHCMRFYHADVEKLVSTRFFIITFPAENELRMCVRLDRRTEVLVLGKPTF